MYNRVFARQYGWTSCNCISMQDTRKKYINSDDVLILKKESKKNIKNE